MMKYILLSSLLFLGSTILAQNFSEDRILDAFTKINALGIEDVYISQGNQNIRVEAIDGDLKKIKTDVAGGVLTISEDKKFNLKGVKVYISVPELTHIKLIGAGNIMANDTLNYKNLQLDIIGAGNVELKLNVLNLKTKIIGSGDVKLSGRAIVHEADISGSGDVMALDLYTDVTNARITGAGDIQVYASEELNVNVSGSGDVFYKDEPKIKNIQISREGDIFTLKADSSDNADTTKLQFKKYKLWIIGDENDEESFQKCDTCKKEMDPFKHWLGLELGANGYIGDHGLSMPINYEFLKLNYAKSINFNLNIIDKGINIYSEYAKIVTGLGFEFNSYSFDNNIALISGSNPIAAFNDSINNYKKNKLNVTYATLPIMLAFNTNKNKSKSFHFSAGVVGGYRIGTKYKQKFSFNENQYKTKTKSNFNVLPYRLSARAGIGYGNFNLYATYSLTEFFEANEGPALHPFSIGIRVIPF